MPLIQGKPIIQHVYERAGKAATLKRLVLATDDSRIREAALRFGVEVLMTSADHGSGTDRVAEAARRLSLPPDAVVVNIQGDEPLLQPEVIDQLVQALVAAPDVPMATLAHQGLGRTDFRDPGVVKVVFDTRKQAIYFSRAPIPHARGATEAPTYYKQVGLYAFRNSFLQHFTSLSPGALEQVRGWNSFAPSSTASPSSWSSPLTIPSASIRRRPWRKSKRSWRSLPKADDLLVGRRDCGGSASLDHPTVLGLRKTCPVD